MNASLARGTCETPYRAHTAACPLHMVASRVVCPRAVLQSKTKSLSVAPVRPTSPSGGAVAAQRTLDMSSASRGLKIDFQLRALRRRLQCSGVLSRAMSAARPKQTCAHHVRSTFRFGVVAARSEDGVFSEVIKGSWMTCHHSGR
jgi:hypothetical protein